MIDWFDVCVTRTEASIHDIELSRPIRASVFDDRFGPSTIRPEWIRGPTGRRKTHLHCYDLFGLTMIEDDATHLVSSAMFIFNRSKVFYPTRNEFAGRFQLGDTTISRRTPEAWLADTGLEFKRINAGLWLTIVACGATGTDPVSVIVESKIRRVPQKRSRNREIVSVSLCPHSSSAIFAHPTSNGRPLSLSIQN